MKKTTLATAAVVAVAAALALHRYQNACRARAADTVDEGQKAGQMAKREDNLKRSPDIRPAKGPGPARQGPPNPVPPTQHVVKKTTLVTAAALAVATTLALHGSAPVPPRGMLTAATHAAGLRRVHDPRHVTGTIHVHCNYRDHGKLPDPRCTPGSIDPAVTQANIHATICKTGYTKKVRPPVSQTERFKYHVAYPAYRERSRTRTELDHLVPLELGGSNDATNLWPESPPAPNPKDTVELKLRDAVCTGRVRLAAAQQVIASDWETGEARPGIR